ncbi:unnamed protein product [Cylindrotheca closterium]|uniref:Kinesin-like protein n=1 Tax=Cylindrotheca closterium TaxID=2856 RepID=A0AAD2CCI0_9STRA|nr:unnamed protein product [Cylindrotheca closterium]
MGLVATWLTGIGLSSAVPTFHAAGITTPSALAELDVNHFEALGISDPNDRRKLFYLVQRIKMAVTKEKADAKGETMEEKVEALINGTIDMVEHEDEGATDSEKVRRSKRLAKKTDSPKKEKKDKDSSKKEKSKKEGKKKSKDKGSDAELSPTKKKKKKKAKSTTESEVDDEHANEEKKEESNAINTPRKATVSAAKANAVFNLDDFDDDTREPQHSFVSTPTRSRRAAATPPRPPTAVNTAQDTSSSVPSNPANPSTPTTSRANSPTTADRFMSPRSTSSSPPRESGISPPRARAMSPPKARAPTITSLPKKALQSNLQPPSAAKITSTKSAIPTPTTSRLQAPKSRRPESKLLNPGTSARTGKPLGAIPSATEANMSPLKPLVTDNLPENSPKLASRGGLLSRRNSRQMSRKNSEVSVGSRNKNEGPFVIGGSEARSWESQVTYLREDNNAEHELFCDQYEDEIYEYDMKIRVIVRKRPLSNNEAEKSGGIDVIHPLDYGDFGKVLVYQPKTRVDLTKEIETVPFSYDNVFGESSTNVDIYQRSLRNLIVPFFKGQWSTVFAYGQTGSGKTYTMMGSNMTGINAGTATDDASNLGLYYLAALDIFDMVQRPEYQHLKVQVSLFEIYGGKLFDLLNSRGPVKCLEDSRGKVCFPGLTEHPIDGPDRLMELIELGAQNRSTGTTSRNADSSRSHAVLQLKLRKDIGRKKNVEHGRLNFIDLAGSERGVDTNNCSRATRLEGAEINTSLLALKEVIRALATGGSMQRIPFRGSKLTQVLKDSFIGENSRCCMVACISPAIENCEQTLNTLRYADRVKERDSESGALPASCDEPVRLNIIPKQPAPLSSEEEEKDTCDFGNTSFEEDEELLTEPPMAVNYSMMSTDTRALDDLLATPRQPSAKPDSADPDSNKMQVGQTLIAAHRSVMSSMLGMVKTEMTLVNKVDGDRDGLDEYLSELQALQSTQLDLISNLREALDNYCNAAEGSSPREHFNDDESFEDLRD